jgi:hypothetical protein
LKAAEEGQSYIDKNLLLTARSIGKPFSRVKGYFSPKISRSDIVFG